MKDHITTSYWCQIGDHEHCQYTWIGAAPKRLGGKPRVVRLVCNCTDCERHKYQKQLARKLRRAARGYND